MSPKVLGRCLLLLLAVSCPALGQPAQYEELKLPFHTAQIRAMDYHGQRLASLSYDGKAFVWEVGRPDPLLWLEDEAAHHIALSFDGRMVAVVLEQEVVVYKVDGGEVLARLTGHEGPVQKAAFSPDSSLLVTSSKDKTVRAWRVSDWGQAYLLQHPEECDAVAFSLDGNLLATCCGWEFGEIRLWDPREGRELRKMSLDTREEQAHPSAFLMPSNVLAFSPDGSRLVSGEFSGCKVWEVNSGLLLMRIDQPTNSGGPGVTAVGVEGDQLLFWDGGKLREVGLQSGEQLEERKTPQDLVRLQIAAGDVIVTGYLHGKVAVGDSAGNQTWASSGLDEAAEDIAFRPGEPRLYGVTLDGTFLEWDGTTGRLSREVETAIPQVRTFAFLSDGSRLVHGTEDGLAVRESESLELLGRLRGHQATVREVEVSVDGRWAVSASDDGTVGVWDLQSEKLVRLLQGHQDAVVEVAVTPEADRIVSVSEDGTVRLWSRQSGEELARFERPGRKTPYSAAAISADGRLLAVAEAFLAEQPVVIWDLETKEMVRLLTMYEDRGAMDLRFSDDGLLWAADLGGRLTCWEPRSGEQRLDLPTGSGYGWALAVSSDGRALGLGTTGQQRAVRFWRKAP